MIVRKALILTIVAMVFAIASGGVPAIAANPSEPLFGSVADASTKEPLVGVVLKIDGGAMWAVTDIDGRYVLPKLNPGTYSVEIECLGYVSQKYKLQVGKSSAQFLDLQGNKLGTNDFVMDVASLALDEVVVTAQRPAGTLGTSHTLGKEALEHLQMSNMTDMAALLPGGKTINPDLTQDNSFSLRDGGSSAGNAAFGTAVEVDGVRLGNNAGMNTPGGVSTRSLPVENVESIEVITGVPSAEYGDLNSGMVKVNTKKGRTPLNIVFSVNPRTYQASVSKGFDLGKKNGVLNLSGEWANATQKITSPYTSYVRRNINALYSNTFKNSLRFEAGATATIGGMNSKDDPDASNGNFEKGRDNNFRANTSLSWMLSKSWITSLKAEASINFADNMTTTRKLNSSATNQPAVYSEEKGYHLADTLARKYYSDQIVDSKELDIAAALKYDWTRSFGSIKNRLKAGVQFKSNGNVGQGEYYADPKTAPNGYRPRPYSIYPFMNNLSEYIEDQVTLPIGSTKLDVTAGLRFEQVFIKNTQYGNVTSLSPRFNAKWQLSEHFTLRGGWGVSEKLPSFWVLYPKQEYRDIQTFAFSSGQNAFYVYDTFPYTTEYNPDLKWQRSNNSELGVDFTFGEWSVSLVGFYNVTKNPYQYTSVYSPISYDILKVPEGFTLPANAQIKVDSQTGATYIRGASDEYWTPMEVKVSDRSFVKSNKQVNGRPITRAGVELTVDFPQIRPIRTSFRLDASYNHSSYVDDLLSYSYNNGWSHTSLPNRSYQYVGIYARGESSSTVNGRITNNMDANITSITHIPQARLVVTCRFEAALLRRSRNLSEYNGAEYAYNVSESSNVPTGGSIYDGNSYAAIRPVAYMDLEGNVHPFTDAQAADPEFSNLIIKTGNAFVYNPDGYGFYCSANLSITKEIGKHVSLSFFANNFTASRPAVTSFATGVSAVFTPSFYYGLTCRVKL